MGGGADKALLHSKKTRILSVEGGRVHPSPLLSYDPGVSYHIELVNLGQRGDFGGG